MSKTILIVDDDKHIRETLEFSLTESGFKCIEAENGMLALRAFSNFNPDLIILDINMPELDGIEVCKQIRKTSEIPIIFLSSREQEVDRILGLELGGDDYISKPFSPRELVVRVKNILKRIKPALSEESTDSFQHKDLILNLAKRTVLWKETAVILSVTEFDILFALIRRPSIVFTREMIIDLAYQENFHLSDRTIDSHMRRIRAKLEQVGADNLIQTIRGVGYKID